MIKQLLNSVIAKYCDLSVSRRSINYRKIPKISPRVYILQRPFLRGLFLEGLIFGRAYLWRNICISKLTGLALQLELNLLFLLCFTLYLRVIFKYKPLGGLYYFEGAIHGGSFALLVWRAYIWRGLCVEGLIFGILWCLPKPKAEVIIIDLLATDKSRYFAQPYPTIVLASG